MSAAVVVFDQAKRKDQIARGKRVQESMNAFLSLMEEHGCDYVYLGGMTPDGRPYVVCSGDSGGVSVLHPGRKGGAA
jgi:hypothetical protein